MMHPLDLISGSWAILAARSVPLAAFGLVIALLGWLASRCRLDLRSRIRASHAALLALTAGALVVLLGPAVEPASGSPLPVVAEMLEAADALAEDLELPLPGRLGARPGAHIAEAPLAISARGIAAGLWLAGAIVGLLGLAAECWRLRRHLRSLPRAKGDELAALLLAAPPRWRESGLPAKVLLDAGARGPYSTRLAGSTIVLPPAWISEHPMETIELALAHEDAHLRHRDSWLLLAWRVARALWWWNPLARQLAAQAEELAEWRADASATGKLPARARALAAALVAMAAGAEPEAAQGMAASTARSLRRRLVQLLSPASTTARFAIFYRGILCLLGAMAIGALIGCAFPGSRETGAFVNGEIVRTTPDAWEQTKKRYPAFATALDSTGAAQNDGGEVARRLEARAKKHGRASERLVKMEIKFIESQVKAPESGTTRSELSVLSRVEADTFLRSMARDPGTKTTSYPRMVGRSGRSVMIRSVVNQPMLASSRTTRAPSGDASTVADIQYVPVGTMMSLCPVFTPSDRVRVETDLVISRIIGEDRFAGNPYPLISAWARSPAFDLTPGESVVIPGPVEKSGRRTHVVITISGESGSGRVGG